MRSQKRKSRPKHKTRKRSFGEGDFVRDVWKTMKDQERKNPTIGLLHEKLEGAIQMIGLTGGIASGKSTVARLFREAKVPVIDADEIAREVVRPKKKAYREIVASFGQGILKEDRTLDREKLAEIVFADESKRTLLESITHPEIMRKITQKVRTFRKKKISFVIVDAALLFESGLDRQMHRNILIRIDPEVQLRRLMDRDGLTEAQAWARILAQMPTAEKEKRAQWMIDNSGSLEGTRRRFEELLLQFLSPT